MSRRRKVGRANSEGTIYLRSDTGRYRAQLTVGQGSDGKPQRVSQQFNSRREAEAWLLQQRASLARGELLLPSNETLAERADGWLDTKSRSVREGTLRDYRTTLERYVLPIIGGVELADLGPGHVEALLNRLHSEGRSAYTINKAHRYLSMVLRDAVRLELAPRNAAQAVKPPRPQPGRHRRWSPEEATKVIELCRVTDHPVARYIVLGLVTGLRREELLGLRWEDVTPAGVNVRQTVTFEEGRATISPALKTAAAHRTVPIDHLGREALEAQLEHVEFLRRTREWREENGLVFPSTVGTPMQESFLREHFFRLIKEAGVPRIRLYDLRSTHGSILAAAGVNPKLISERLGHADVAFTLQVYVRTREEEARAVAGVFEEQVQRGATERLAPRDRRAGGAGDTTAPN